VLRAARAMRECDALLLLADDPVALVDVPALAAAHGWSVQIAQAPDHSRFLLEKAHADAAC
jgi:TusA-related sulfurtransferase